MTKRAYMMRHKKRMSRFERQFTPLMFEAIKAQISSFITDLEKGIEYAKSRMNNELVNPQASKVVRDIYLTVGSFFVNDTIKEINGLEKKGFGVDERWINALLNYFRTDLLTKAVFPISETTRKQILEVLTRAQTQGWGVDRIVRELGRDELIIWRARMIVRTESARAMFYGQKIGEQESNWESIKVWIAADDHRTRHSHNDIDNKVTEGKFAVPVYKNVGKVDIQIGVDMMEGPGDPRATAGNLINCRCTIARRLKKDANGKFIRKRSITI
jgi:uncharacterized protein with gpF-like domain